MDTVKKLDEAPLAKTVYVGDFLMLDVSLDREVVRDVIREERDSR